MTESRGVSQTAGTVVVVGDDDLAALLERHRMGPVLRVADYLEALGEIGRGSVRTVLGRVSPMATSVEPTVRALRELGGDCRLVLCVDGDEEPAAMKAVRLGFDDYLIRPVRVDELRHALGGPVGRPAVNVDPNVIALAGSSQTAKAPKRESAPQSGGTARSRTDDHTPDDHSNNDTYHAPNDTTDPVDDHADHRSFTRSEDRPAVIPPPSTHTDPPFRGGEPLEGNYAESQPRSFVFQPGGTPSAGSDRTATEAASREIVDEVERGRSAVAWRADEDLAATRVGDIELVEQLLRDRRGVMEMALEAIRQRLPGHDVRWAVEADRDARSCLEVRYGRHALGYLVSDTAAEQWLTGYSAWLGRWLMLARHIDHLNELALRDELTGVWNRRYFLRFINVILRRARSERFRVTLMLYDIDNFKAYNDRYGHEAGDEILVETARLMQSVIRKQDVVARIGGDEFAVIFWDAEPARGKGDHPHTVRAAAERFQKALADHRFPKLIDEVRTTLTISGGLAGYPWDGQAARQLMRSADQMLLESKRQGKNAITFGPGAVKDIESEEYQLALDRVKLDE